MERGQGLIGRDGARSSRSTVAKSVFGEVQLRQLLMLSEIRPADHLTELGIAPIAGLPVGNNLQDHLKAETL